MENGESKGSKIEAGTLEDGPSTEAYWNCERILHLLLLGMGYFLSWCAYDVLSTFFPFEARSKGTSETVIGLFFSIYPLLGVFLSFTCGNTLFRIGPYRVLVIGILLHGVSIIALGFVTLLPDGAVFIVVCMLLRLFGAINATAVDMSVMVIVMSEYPDKIGTVMAFTENLVALGLLLGPILGGSLYTVGGFKLPCLVVGGTLLVATPFYACALKQVTKESPEKTAEETSEQASYLKAFRIPEILALYLCMMYTGIAFGIPIPILAPYMKQFGFNSMKVGFLAGGGALGYAVVAQVCGHVSDKINGRRAMIITGLVSSSLAFLCFGPSPILPFLPNRDVVFAAISYVLSQTFLGFTLIPSVSEMVEVARMKGFADEQSRAVIMSGLSLSSLHIGVVLGSLLGGGVLTEVVGFKWASTGLSFWGFFLASVMVVLYIHERIKTPKDATAEYQPIRIADLDDETR